MFRVATRLCLLLLLAGCSQSPTTSESSPATGGTSPTASAPPAASTPAPPVREPAPPVAESSPPAAQPIADPQPAPIASPEPQAGARATCSEPRPEMCTQRYDPVCATRDTGVRCVTTPCPSTEQKTMGNSCTACSDPKVISYVKGECPAG